MQKIIIDEYKLNETLNEGGVISFVSDTVWGLGCLPENEKAVNKIYEIKGRDREKPLILMSNEIQYLLPLDCLLTVYNSVPLARFHTLTQFYYYCY